MSRTRLRFVIGLGAMALLLALGACAPLTVLNALAATGDRTRVADMAYGSLARQQLDMYVPGGVAPAGE